MNPFWIFDPGSRSGTSFGFSIRRFEQNKVLCLALYAVFFAFCVSADAQQPPTKVIRLGWLSLGVASSQPGFLDAFRKGLIPLGYVEGKNIEILYRYAEGKSERLPGLAEELVRSQVSIIVTNGTAATKAAKDATKEIPIVVTSAGDLVGEGIVPSLSRPGSNVTGLSALSPELSGKRLEILKESFPNTTRFAVIWHRNPNDEKEVKQTEIAALAMRIQLRSWPVQSPDDFQNVFAAMRTERAGGVIFIQGPVLGIYRKQLFELAAESRLPSICDSPTWTEGGCLMSYGTDRLDLFRRAATYVDKILKGARPADLPVEQPKKFEFVINLKTAKQIGLTIPESVLFRADKVIR